jgi:hypothetical protein
MARLYLGMASMRLTPGPAVSDKSLKLDELTFALREKVSLPRIRTLIKERGVSFFLTPESERDLRRAGADDEVIRQIRASSNQSAPAGLKDIEQSLKELQSWQTRVQSSEAGKSWDANQQISKQLKSDLSLLASGKIRGPEFLEGLEAIGRLVDEELDQFKKAETK